MKTTSKRHFTPKNLMRLATIILCGAILGVNVYLVNASRLFGDSLPMPFGYGAAVVLSGSMEPKLFRGDLIFVKEYETYKEREIVVYQDGKKLTVHRIISVDGKTVVTKGDANDTEDAPVDVSAIKGKVLFRIPFAGHIVSFIKTPIGTIFIIAAAILLIEIPRKNEKKKDDEERQKILDEINRLKAQK